nr:hypothetical protein [uncultured Flavobacterium sp.]
MKKQNYAMALLCVSAMFTACTVDDEMVQKNDMQQEKVLEAQPYQTSTTTSSAKSDEPVKEEPEETEPGNGNPIIGDPGLYPPSIGNPGINPPFIDDPGITDPENGDDLDKDKTLTPPKKP